MTSTTTNPYKLLGLSEQPKPTLKQVHDTYHTLAREHHPDKNLLTSEDATAKFQAIQSAYATILTEFTLAGDAEATSKDGPKLAKPWAARKGRKFNHRAMSEVENLKKNAAKAAAQRALADVLGQEGGERPKEKARAKEWDRERRVEEDASSRLRAERKKKDNGEVVKEEMRRRKEAGKQADGGKMGTSLVRVRTEGGIMVTTGMKGMCV
jgi:curved DNA-binding protein CbpA